MIEPRLVLCSGVTVPADDPLRAGRSVVMLDSLGPDPNVNIRLENVGKVVLRRLSPRLVDLLEIAAYVFSADAATRRGAQWTDGHSTEAWGRNFQFVIPVRDLNFWCRGDVKQLLVQTLTFLSDDEYAFHFQKLDHDRPTQGYLEFGDDWDWALQGVERVLMFSGGLDALAGAAETADEGTNLVLVSHRPVSNLDSRQRRLFDELRSMYPVQMIHVPVWINKVVNLGRESTQRTRSFLYTALGAVVAEAIGAGGVRFFENGIVSLNLPIADEVLRARASRTTHPRSLHLLTLLCSLIMEREFVVDNPYIL